MAEPWDGIREQFIEADQRFKDSLTAAFTAHSQCVGLFLAALGQAERREAALQQEVHELRESVEQLRELVMEQGTQIGALKAEVQDLRAQLGRGSDGGLLQTVT